MTWKFWTTPDPVDQQYRAGWRAGFVAAERASVRARLAPRTPWRSAERVTVAALIDRLAAERGLSP